MDSTTKKRKKGKRRMKADKIQFALFLVIYKCFVCLSQVDDKTAYQRGAIDILVIHTKNT